MSRSVSGGLEPLRCRLQIVYDPVVREAAALSSPQYPQTLSDGSECQLWARTPMLLSPYYE